MGTSGTAGASRASMLRGSVTADGTVEEEPISVLVDGADTEVTANGLPGYLPKTGDRVLVSVTGSQVEVLQFITGQNKRVITGAKFQTAPSGPRVEIEQLAAGFTIGLQDVRFYTGDDDEATDGPGFIGAEVFGTEPDEEYHLKIAAPVSDLMPPGGNAYITLVNQVESPFYSEAVVKGQVVKLTAGNSPGDDVRVTSGDGLTINTGKSIYGVDGGFVSDTTDANSEITIAHTIGVSPWYAAMMEGTAGTNMRARLTSVSSSQIKFAYRNTTTGVDAGAGVSVNGRWVAVG